MHWPLTLMHSAPWTKHSVSMPQFLAMCSISSKVSSRARITREKPISAAFFAPAKVCTVIWVLAWRGRSGAIWAAREARPRSCTMRASTPASAAARIAWVTAGSSSV